jgi:hypothetical protein
LPEKFRAAAELYSGCVAGAVDKFEYLETIRGAGFENVQIQKERPIGIPDEFLKQFGSEEDVIEFRKCGVQILSITVYADKPGKSEMKKVTVQSQHEKKVACCGVDSNCC